VTPPKISPLSVDERNAILGIDIVLLSLEKRKIFNGCNVSVECPVLLQVDEEEKAGS
jgi:hypothetical protein